jgi:hypothetical protein
MFNNAEAGPSSGRATDSQEGLGRGQPRTPRATKARAISARQGPTERWRFSVPLSVSLVEESTLEARMGRSRAKQTQEELHGNATEQRLQRNRSVERPFASASFVSARGAGRDEALSSWAGIENLVASGDEDDPTPTSSFSQKVEDIRGPQKRSQFSRNSPSGLQPRSYATFSGTSTPSRTSFAAGPSEPPSPSPLGARRRLNPADGNTDSNSTSRQSIFTSILPPVASSRIKRRPHADSMSVSPETGGDDAATTLCGGTLSSSPPLMNSILPSEESTDSDAEGDKDAGISHTPSESEPLLAANSRSHGRTAAFRWTPRREWIRECLV